MDQCIKCGKEIPKGELFCVECGMNPGSSLFQEPRPAPVGRMQAPVPVKTAPRTVAVAEPERKPRARAKKSKKNTGLKAALVLVTLLLVLVTGFLAWEYTDIKAERNRLATKETDLVLREKENEELKQQIETLQTELETLQTAMGEKEEEIKALSAQLEGSQSDQNQSWYDMTVLQAELTRLEDENRQLLLLEDDLEAQLKELKGKAGPAAEKAAFLDKYVVFANNDGSYVYHTYDCEKFSKRDFWAYSRKLAENQGFEPCPTCGGKVE